MASAVGAKFGKNVCDVDSTSILFNSTIDAFSLLIEAQLKFLYDFVQLCIKKEGLLPEAVLIPSPQSDDEAGKCLFVDQRSVKGKLNHI